MKRFLLATFALLSVTAAAHADETNVAVAANFTAPAKEIATAFEQKTGHKAILSFGATGQFFAQIKQDAPFTVFLAADDETPRKAVEEGLAVPESRFTYAVGRLVLWTKASGAPLGEDTLRKGAFEKIAIANPATAPYGAAAVQAMKKMGVHDALQPKIVQGNSIAQTFQFADTGAAELAFVALSQVIAKPDGTRWPVPETLHDPIFQDAVLLKKGAGNEAAKAFLAFLKGPEAAAVISKYGYGTKVPN
ncbi:molybdate ABC transporter substrate-binding protein [Azospirillum isscasi]|uniref:Molybdate ABC transporter substrate-binding protein n=1 Tax=Azospirillum isscasi TaxID=3053926 RepID=A0ABU0WNI7_9PROT|nr:molybdate ABC transporter substrate-binding protein [Azospirillum isscasi]MDQ2105810.1 molybdate ABC transporter substrate-binding protein [Azospirillum isscasi]